MKRYILITVVFLCATLGVFSQDYEYLSNKNLDFYRNYKMKTGNWKIINSEKDYEGSPYLINEFVKGAIYTNTKQQYTDIPLRYNIFTDEIEFKTPDNQLYAFTNSDIIEKVVFDGFKMVCIPYLAGGKIRKGYFRTIIEGNASLYARHQVLLKEATKGDNYTKGEPTKFIKKPDTYYINVGSSQAKKVGKKKELAAIFPKHIDKIETFIQKNKTKPGKQESLEELVQYYNSLE